MANYQGLNCIMGEITTMVSNAKPPHDQHIYDYFFVTEKLIRTTVPQLFMDCMEQFRDKLVMEFETYLNGNKIYHGDIQKGVADILQKVIDESKQSITISI